MYLMLSLSGDFIPSAAFIICMLYFWCRSTKECYYIFWMNRSQPLTWEYVWYSRISYFASCHLFVSFVNLPSVLWHCWLGGRKGIWSAKKRSGEVLAWLSVWSEVQTCIWPSWCHCHSLSLASVKSRLILPFWYRFTRVVRDKGPLNGYVCEFAKATVTGSVKRHIAMVCVCDCHMQAKAQRSGIYTCCEMLKKLHSVRFTYFAFCFSISKWDELHTVFNFFSET